jgi:acylphosphatase
MSADREMSRAFKVHGRVQGVGFRWWAQHQARRLGLRGIVRNCRDGTVEIALAGRPEVVDEMLVLLREGPPSARVTKLEEQAFPNEVGDGFDIGF